MSLRVLGCCGSMARGCATTALLLDHDVLIDAGSGVGNLTLTEMAAIDHVVLTHGHLDHVLALPLLADSVMRQRQPPDASTLALRPIHVHALPATLQVLRQHVFNDALWPNFLRLPTPAAPILQLHEITVGQTLRLGASARRIEVLPAAHSVPAVGYAIEKTSGRWLVFSGDTGPNPALWRALGGRGVDELIIELSFPALEAVLALESGHHCPQSLASELAHGHTSLNAGAPAPQIWLTHSKPGDQALLIAQARAHLAEQGLGAWEVALLREQQVFDLG